MPGWQALYEELAGDGLLIVAIALDEHDDAVRPLTAGTTIPILIDREHLLTELLAISNVPTVIWVDENDEIVRPNASEMGSDIFVEFTGVKSEIHKQLVRDWVRNGVLPPDAAEARELLTDLNGDEVAARLHFRLAVHLQRDGDEAGAARHFDRAAQLAPFDFTIVRAAMPLRGANPFGEEFMTLFEEWKEAGSPYHGLTRRPER